MNNITAIELGSDKITCAIATLENETDKVRILGFASTPSRGIKRAHVVDIQEATRALETCLTAVERMAGTRVNRALVVANGPSIASQTSHGIVAVNFQNKEIVQEDVDRANESAKAISLAANRQIIHVLPKEFIVDGQSGIKNPIGMSGVRLEVNTHIITTSATNLNNIQKTCSLLGVEVDGFVFAGLSSSYATLSDTQKELGCVLADIGGGTISLCVYIEGALVHTAVIPIGAKSVTSDIAAGLRISLESAEKIKLYLSHHAPHHKVNKKTPEETPELNLSSLNIPEELPPISQKLLIDEIIKPRLEEIAQFIKRELNACGAFGQIPSGLILTGGGSGTPFIENVLEEDLNLPIHRASPVRLEGLADELYDPRYSSLAGALLYSKTLKEEKKSFTMPEFGNIFKNFDVKNTTNKVVDFLKSFIPGVK